MNKDETLKIIEDEKLINYKWFKNEWVADRRIVNDIVAIDHADAKWVTYIIGERDWIIDETQLYFDSEEEAMDDFIRRLRLTKRIIDRELEERRRTIDPDSFKMTKKEALEIIKDEKLIQYKWFRDECYGNRTLLNNVVAIDYIDGKWLTYIIGEGDSMIPNSESYFDSEEKAVDDFIWKLRMTNEIIESRANFEAREAEEAR